MGVYLCICVEAVNWKGLLHAIHRCPSFLTLISHFLNSAVDLRASEIGTESERERGGEIFFCHLDTQLGFSLFNQEGSR